MVYILLLEAKLIVGMEGEYGGREKDGRKGRDQSSSITIAPSAASSTTIRLSSTEAPLGEGLERFDSVLSSNVLEADLFLLDSDLSRESDADLLPLVFILPFVVDVPLVLWPFDRTAGSRVGFSRLGIAIMGSLVLTLGVMSKGLIGLSSIVDVLDLGQPIV